MALYVTAHRDLLRSASLLRELPAVAVAAGIPPQRSRAGPSRGRRSPPQAQYPTGR